MKTLPVDYEETCEGCKLYPCAYVDDGEVCPHVDTDVYYLCPICGGQLGRYHDHYRCHNLILRFETNDDGEQIELAQDNDGDWWRTAYFKEYVDSCWQPYTPRPITVEEASEILLAQAKVCDRRARYYVGRAEMLRAAEADL